MAGKYFPFRSEAGDRKYSAEDWAAYFALFIGNGVFYGSADKLKVAEDNGMKVKVQKGAGFIAGRMYLLEEDTTITLDTADGVLNRIDRIVLRCDYANRLMTVTAKKGGYDKNPTAPELTRNADAYELALADVYVAAGAVTITAANITDQRFNTSLCGIVTGLIDQADTEEIFSQFQAYLEEFKETSQEDFKKWFEYVKAVLDEDATGNLLTQIEVERARIDALTKLEEGSTTGDAELQDIRIGANGVTYETAGEAVRAQVRQLYSENDATKNGLNKAKAELANGLEKINAASGYINSCFDYEQVVKKGTEIIVDRDMFGVKYDKKPMVLLPNRFDYTSIQLTASAYNGNHTLTHENNGIKIVRKAINTIMYAYCLAEYVCEFTGVLWFSCNAKADNVIDLLIKLKLNDTVVESIYGSGRVYCSIPVEKGNTVSMLFYTCVGNTDANTIEYSNIMLQYGKLTDFKAFGYNENLKTVQLPTDIALYTTMTTAASDIEGIPYYRVLIPISSVVNDFDSAYLPMKNSDVADGIEVIGLPKVSYDDTYNSINGVGIGYNGNLTIQVDGKGREPLMEYLENNPVSIVYHSTEIDTTTLRASSIVTSESGINMVGISTKETRKTIKHIAMGDSITGMFGHGTSYPEMITRASSKVNSINVGFSGSQITDHSNENYKAFSFNRLVNAIVSKDWTLQDAAISNLTAEYYAEHLTILKGIDFKKVDYLTLFYGTNDWGSSVLLETTKTVYVESITKLLTAFPNLKIIVISPYWRAVTSGKDSNVDANLNGEYLYDFADTIEELAKKNFNCPTINYYRTLGANAITNRHFTQDGTHPTFSTREKIAKDLINLMN